MYCGVIDRHLKWVKMISDSLKEGWKNEVRGWWERSDSMIWDKSSMGYCLADGNWQEEANNRRVFVAEAVMNDPF